MCKPAESIFVCVYVFKPDHSALSSQKGDSPLREANSSSYCEILEKFVYKRYTTYFLKHIMLKHMHICDYKFKFNFNNSSLVSQRNSI